MSAPSSNIFGPQQWCQFSIIPIRWVMEKILNSSFLACYLWYYGADDDDDHVLDAYIPPHPQLHLHLDSVWRRCVSSLTWSWSESTSLSRQHSGKCVKLSQIPVSKDERWYLQNNSHPISWLHPWHQHDPTDPGNGKVCCCLPASHVSHVVCDFL